MAMTFSRLAVAGIFFLLATVSSAQTACTSQTFSSNRLFAFCNDLPTLNAFIHWTYDSSQSRLSIAFIAPPAAPGGWISWAINPTGTGMSGSQALVAFSDGSGGMTVRTYSITGTSLSEPSTWFRVENSTAEVSGGVMSIFATLVLPVSGITTVNQVWQVGSAVNSGFPAVHQFQPANLNARGSLDLLRGQSTNPTPTGGNPRITNRNIHGILNVVSWGLLFPIGILFARYLKVFPSADPAWFYLHVSCQVSAYAIGVAGWATGMRLGSESSGITYHVHRNIGITLFTLATLQVFALFLRPKKDHKYRCYWVAYHHGVGYAIVSLGIANVFRGLEILQPGIRWRNAYIAAISVIGGVAVVLEVITWIVVLRRKRSGNSTKPLDGNGHSRQCSVP